MSDDCVGCKSTCQACRDPSIPNQKWSDASSAPPDIWYEAADVIQVMRDDFKTIMKITINDEIRAIAERHVND